MNIPGRGAMWRKRPGLVNSQLRKHGKIEAPLLSKVWEELGKMSLQILSSELSNLIQESKRKHSELRTVCPP